MAGPQAAKAYWKEVQKALDKHGFSPGDIDGIRGAMTDGALIRFKSSRGLRARAYIGPITEKALWADAPKPPEAWPSWLTVAHSYAGLREVPGPRDNRKIVNWWTLIGAGWFDDDETPWCGAFVGGTLIEDNKEILPSHQAPRARAWEHWGQKLDEPAVGAVVTFWRNSRTSGAGHVGFVVGKMGSNLAVLGGNQSNAVNVKGFGRNRVTSYRWPSEATKPSASGIGFSKLPRVTGSGLTDGNEA